MQKNLGPPGAPSCPAFWRCALALGLTITLGAKPKKNESPNPAHARRLSPPAETSAPRRLEPAEPQPKRRAQFDEKLWSGMQWREIGPFRGGRAVAIEGVPGEPNTYYFGAVAGGIWKTTDGGANWKPIFDKQHSTSSIGAHRGRAERSQHDLRRHG